MPTIIYTDKTQQSLVKFIKGMNPQARSREVEQVIEGASLYLRFRGNMNIRRYPPYYVNKDEKMLGFIDWSAQNRANWMLPPREKAVYPIEGLMDILSHVQKVYVPEEYTRGLCQCETEEMAISLSPIGKAYELSLDKLQSIY